MTRARTVRVCLIAACAYVSLGALFRTGFDADWYSLDRVLSFTEGPPFQHRILVVLFAKLVQCLTPSLSTHVHYLVSQVPILVCLFWSMERLARLHVPSSLSLFAPPLTALMYIPSIAYFTFYDTAVILMYALGLYALFTEQYLVYTMIIVVGTLNHEVSLLLIPLGVIVDWNHCASRMRLLGTATVQVVLYVLVRMTLFLTLPASSAWQSGKLAFNLDLLVHHPEKLVRSVGPGALVIWYMLAALGLRRADSRLRRCVVLFPMILIVTLLVGQLNESRMFNCMIPVVVVLSLHAISQESRQRCGVAL